MKVPRSIFVCLAVMLAVSIPIGSSAVTQQDVVGYWTFDLKPGFNLVAFPVVPDTPTLQNVIGNSLGSVEITTWDRGLGRYRWARYNPDTEQWSGDLFLLDRGVAYWINLFDSDGERPLIVAGHPEVYTRFNWESYGRGWKNYAPTIGREQALNDIPPGSVGDLIISWNDEQSRFELAEATSDNLWLSNDFNQFLPDRSYLVFLNASIPPPQGPPLPQKTVFVQPPENRNPRRDDGLNDESYIESPPYPLIVGNRNGLPVCQENGDVCSGGFRVEVVRETMQLSPGGELDPFLEVVDAFDVAPGGADEGRFRLTLTIGQSREFLNPGDRVFLAVRGARGAETRSTSFEIPEGDRFVPDVSFPTPMGSPDKPPATPASFALATPFPNPFNDRFHVEFSLPETAPVSFKLYDMMGREVMSDDRPFIAGTHRLSISAGGISTGLYVVEIKSGSYRGLAKIAHIK